MMKSARLKCSSAWMHFGKPIFPETNPTFDSELQIVRRAEQMQVIRHQQIIADEPCSRRVLPDLVKRALNRSPRQPLTTFCSTDREKDPIRSAKRNMNAFRRRAATGFTEKNFAHGRKVIAGLIGGKDFRMGRAATLPCQIKSWQGGVAAPP